MKRTLLTITIAYLAFCSCAFYKAQIPGYFYDDGYYKNSSAGFKVHLPEDWDIGTTPKTVPEILKDQFKNLQTVSSEMLFVGLNPNQRCGIRCIAEASDTTLEAYFKLIYSVNENGITKRKAEYFKVHGQELINWSYYTETNGTKMRFNEYIFNPGRLKIRLTFWTINGLYDDYQKIFDETAHTIFLSDTTQDTSKLWLDKPVLIAKDSAEFSKVIDFATDKKELFFASNSTDTICSNRNKTFMWKITGGPSVCYILGSIHLLKPEMYPLKKVIEDAFDSSSSLVLELDNTRPENIQKITAMLKNDAYKPNESLKQEITPQLYDTLISWVSKKGYSAEQFSKLKPWMAALVLQQLQMRDLGLSFEYGMEKYFTNKKAAKEIYELETVDEQLSLFKALKGQDFLAYTFFDIENTSTQMEMMLNAWLCGNTDAINKITIESVPAGSEELLNQLIYSRNEKMATRIKDLIGKKQKHFIVIGSAHLVGERSVIKLLEKSGLKVEQM
jgi:uncharacterized protein YbaP (TraB family)